MHSLCHTQSHHPTHPHTYIKSIMTLYITMENYNSGFARVCLDHIYSVFSEWSDEQIAPSRSVNILRLIYQGRFLHCNVTLGGRLLLRISLILANLSSHFLYYYCYLFTALQLPLGKTTVMHLVARENLPEPNNQGMT